MIEGLKLTENWLDEKEQWQCEAEAAKVLSTVRPTSLKQDRSRVLRYGWAYETAKDAHPRRLDVWPDWLEQLRLKLPHPPSVEGCAITLNEYAPGYRIGPHVDSLCVNEPIQSISLGAEAELRFTRPDHSGLADSHIILLHPGTLCILTGEVRYQWFHEIQPVKGLRYSIVFREYPLTN